MTRILVMSDTRSLAYIKSHLSEIVDQVERQHERVILTRNGEPAAVILSPDDLAALEDTLDLLSDPEAMLQLAVARQQIAQGDVVAADELRARYLSK